MAAAYAGLVSLLNLIEQLNHHPDPPISLDPEQVHSLTEKVGFLQGFLEDFHSRGISREIKGLESRIADVAHATEDVIESHIAFASASTLEEYVIENRSSADLCEGLRRVIQDMGFIEKEAMDTITKMSKFEDDQLRGPPVLPPSLIGSSLTDKTNQIMVGFDEILIRIMDRLTGNESRRIIVSIVGMGGSGKTTLARAIYEKKLIVEHFDVRSWVTISKDCVIRQVLIEILLCQRNPKSKEELSQESEQQLGEQLYKNLCGRKYLIVMDDVWDIEVWDKLKKFFPTRSNGSRIIITTRLSKLASYLTGSHGVINVDLLDEDTSWDLLCKKVFSEKSCPLGLEKIGRKIARNCRGLPLSIVTIGGLLAKSGMTRKYWKYVAKNLSSLVNSEDDDRCLRILSLSYDQLPVHLKPCFLYMGIFPEDRRIEASFLIRLWVAEGFLKSISWKALEAVGEDCLKDLVERNLVSVRQEDLGSTGKIRYCVVHDLLRDLCLREAQKEKFFFVERIDNIQGNWISESQQRIAIRHSHGFLYSMPFLRSCIVDSNVEVFRIFLESVQPRLMRILAGDAIEMYYGVDDIVPLVNLRFLSIRSFFTKGISLSWSKSWNMQTLIVHWCGPHGGSIGIATLDIWKMPQLRHAKFSDDDFHICLSDPPSSNEDGGRLLVLENLQTLCGIRNFKCSEEVVKTIPNIKKLGIVYYRDEGRTWTYYCLNNLGLLKNLLSLNVRLLLGRTFATRFLMENWLSWLPNSLEELTLSGLTLPNSLKKLTLSGLKLDSERMNTMIGGSLPLLQVLKLRFCTFVGNEWNLVEGNFCNLKYLLLCCCDDLKSWNADDTHFPSLDCVRIVGTTCLEKFPSGIGDIPTLRSIVLELVNRTLVVSAWKMLVEQLENNTEVFQIHVYTRARQKKQLKGLACDNFKISVSRISNDLYELSKLFNT